MRTTTSRIALGGLAGAMALLAVTTPRASATYQGNDGRLFFGAFDPANGRSADLYSTHAERGRSAPAHRVRQPTRHLPGHLR